MNFLPLPHGQGSFPNTFSDRRHHAVLGQLFQFFHYDPEILDWHVYGTGTVTNNGAQAVPGPKARLYELTCAMISGWSSPPRVAPTPDGPTVANPVDPSTGVFVMHKTDLATRRQIENLLVD